MLSPVIMIGCGGSGTKAVRFVRDAVVRRLQEAGWKEPLPGAWTFLGLDTNEREEDTMMVPPFPPGDFLEVSLGFDDYQTLYDQCLQAHSPTSDFYREHLLGWLPERNGPDVQLNDGAGQFRAVGRTAGIFGLENEKISSKLKEAFTNAERGLDLNRVSEQLTGISTGNPGSPIVVICASMAGGTGAGIALDVVDFVRRIHKDGQNPALILFTNDIIPDGQTAHKVGNSMAMLAELLATYWNKDKGASGPGDMFKHSEGSPGHGPTSVWTISSRGMEQESIGDSNIDAYHATGEALSGWVTDSNIQTKIKSWLAGNVQASATLSGRGYPFGDAQPGVIYSFGAAVVTVGRTRFKRWAQDLLSRVMMEKMLHGHNVHSNLLPDPDKKLTEAKRVEKIAVDYWRVIYGDEYPELQELDSLEWKGLANAEHTFLPVSSKGIRTDITKQLDDHIVGSTKMTPGDWVTSLTSAYDTCLESVRGDAQTIPPSEQRQWAAETTRQVATSTSYVLAKTSIDVTVQCLEECVRYLESRIAFLQENGVDAVNKAESTLNECRQKLQETRGRISLERSDSSVIRAVDSTVDLLVQEWYLEREKEISKLYKLAVSEVLVKMQQILQNAQRSISDAFRPGETRQQEVGKWPKNTSNIPPQYCPSAIELPLESDKEWKELFDDLCKDAIRPATEGQLPIDAARILLVAGDKKHNPNGIGPFVSVDADKPWSPGYGAASFLCGAKSNDISERVASWMQTGHFDEVVREGIADYLTPDRGFESSRTAVNYELRRQHFRQLFEKAIKSAQPLVEIDQDLAGIIYRGPRKVTVDIECSALPFGESDSWLDDIKKVFDQYVENEKQLELRGGDTPSILVTGFISNPVHPLIVRPLTDPIAKIVQEYRSRGNNDLQSQVWLWKRARTLLHSTALPPDAIAAMIRGFAIGRLCGYITGDGSQPVTISATPKTVGENAEVIAFPWPFLSQVKTKGEILPALLESFIQCYADVGQRRLDAFEAYRRLFELGNRSNQSYLDDVKCMLKGEPLPRRTVDTPQVVSGSDISERRTAATETLQGSINFFEAVEKTQLTGGESRSKEGYSIDVSSQNVALREILPLARECYEIVKADVAKLFLPSEEDPV